MNVLLVTPHFPPRRIGGVEHHTHRLASWLSAHGYRIEVVCVEEVRFGAEEKVSAATDLQFGYPVHRLQLTSGDKRAGFRLYWRSQRLEGFFDSLMATLRPSVMHVHSGYLLGGPAVSVAIARRIPTVVTLHDFWFICPRITMMHPSLMICSGPQEAAKCAWCLKTELRRYRVPDQWTHGALGRVARLTVRLLQSAGGRRDSPVVSSIVGRSQGLLAALSSVQGVLSPSRYVRDQVERAGFKPGVIEILPNGVEDNDTVSRPGGETSPLLRIAYLGQLLPHKGVHVLLRAARRVHSQNVSVSVFGPDWPPSRYVQSLRWLSRGDRRIRFAGPYRPEDLGTILADVDLVVVPSIWHENWPYVVLEAHRSHVPVIASRIGGLPEMIRHDEDGLLFTAGDDRELARWIQRLADDPLLLARLQQGIRPVQSEDGQFGELLATYAHAVSALASDESGSLQAMRPNSATS
jgi:glycosyltransferase involved in cell wall biosynthesis